MPAAHVEQVPRRIGQFQLADYLAQRDADVQLTDLEEAVNSFIDPLDPDLLALQEHAAVLACSALKRRYRDRAGVPLFIAQALLAK